MEKSIPSPITDVMECEQLSSCSAQGESQYVPVHRMTDTDSTNFHGSLRNRAQTAACLESTAGSWAIDRFFLQKPVAKEQTVPLSPAMNTDDLCNAVSCHPARSWQRARVSSPAVLPFQQAAVCGNLHFQASLDVQQYAVLVVLSLHVRAELPQLSL